MKIYARKEPCKDDGTATILKGKDGKFYKVYGILPHEYATINELNDPRGWRIVNATRGKINKRAVEIFFEID